MSRYSSVTPAASRLYPRIGMHYIHGSTGLVWIQRLGMQPRAGDMPDTIRPLRPCDRATVRPCDLALYRTVYWSRSMDTDSVEWIYGLQ
ncbi:hypothetical protein N7465_000667 [Penicillium sp. CMV-2018d]|nr:hypothetical protein N7465_000667 [Penicillium sp. CMV-2018d]